MSTIKVIFNEPKKKDDFIEFRNIPIGYFFVDACDDLCLKINNSQIMHWSTQGYRHEPRLVEFNIIPYSGYNYEEKIKYMIVGGDLMVDKIVKTNTELNSWK